LPLLQGVIAAAVTPCRAQSHDIDLGAALDVVDYLNAARVRGIAVFGATGDFCHFAVDERIRFACLAVKRSRVPLVVNVSHSAFDISVQLAEEAAQSGASAVLLMPPYFFRYEQAEIREYYLRFADELAGRLPILLYNIPGFTNPIAIETAIELLTSGAAAGIKDSGGDWSYLECLLECRRQKPFTLMVGDDNLFVRGRGGGADGGISGVACAVPELMLALDAGPTPQLETRLQEFLSWIGQFPAPLIVREAVRLRGRKVGPHAIPLSPGRRRRLEEFGEWFGGWLAAVQRETKA
jgi:4-hydroxy-tetrahydrodipicolinate synthase